MKVMIHTLHLYMIGDPPPSSGGQQKHVYVCISSYSSHFSRGPVGWENLGTHHRQDSCCCQKEPFSIDKSKDRNSNMHDFWRAKILEQKNKLQTIPKTNNEKNRYFMPNFFSWLEAKLPYIMLWSNLCLGDLRRFNSNYHFSIAFISGNTFLIVNRMNASAEQFFNMKKANKAELQLILNQFILKCWEDNRGLRRQFYNK